MFFNLKKLYLFLGCIVFSINNLTSDAENHFMNFGLLNYQELRSELQKFVAQIDEKLAKQFATKKEMESSDSRLNGILLRLNETERVLDGMKSRVDTVEKESRETINIEYFSHVIDALSERCASLEQKILIFYGQHEALRQENWELRNALYKSLEDFKEHNQRLNQKVMILVLELQERVNNLERIPNNSFSLPSSRSSTPRPDQVKGSKVSEPASSSGNLLNEAFTKYEDRQDGFQKALEF
jgi:hypothetical protein